MQLRVRNVQPEVDAAPPQQSATTHKLKRQEKSLEADQPKGLAEPGLSYPNIHTPACSSASVGVTASVDDTASAGASVCVLYTSYKHKCIRARRSFQVLAGGVYFSARKAATSPSQAQECACMHARVSHASYT